MSIALSSYAFWMAVAEVRFASRAFYSAFHVCPPSKRGMDAVSW